MGALYDLAEVPGLNVFQLQGAGLDGTVALSRFLQPGTYTFFALQKGGKPFRYERIGTATLPSDGTACLRIGSAEYREVVHGHVVVRERDTAWRRA